MPGSPETTAAAIFDRIEGKAEGEAVLSAASRRAHAKAAVLLAARECPDDLIQWGRIHGIPTFAEATWQAGFLAGMRAAMMEPANVE